MNSRVVAAIAAAILAVVGIGAVVVYAAGANSRAFGDATLVSVYRTTEDIGANANADEVSGKVEIVKLPNAAVAKGAIKDLNEIKDLKTTVPLVAGEQLVIARFAQGGSSAVAGSNVPKGLQEVSVQLARPNASADLLGAGQRVGIILAAESKEGDQTARMFAQSVLVSAVKDNGDSVVVTFAVNGTLATQISAAAQWGQIRLTVQNDDTEKDGGKAVNPGSLVK